MDREIIFRNINNFDLSSCLGILQEKYSGQPYHYFKTLLESHLSGSVHRFLVAEKNESLIGFGAFVPTHQQNVYQLFWINISKPEQRQGFGRQLIMELEKKIMEYDHNKFTIVLETDKPVFYEKLGYHTFLKNENYVMMKVFPAFYGRF